MQQITTIGQEWLCDYWPPSMFVSVKDVYACKIYVEATEALPAAKFSKDLGLQDIILEGDCLQVVKVTKFSDPIMDVQLGMHGGAWWSTMWSKAAVRATTDYVWIEKIPSFIFDLVTLDLSAL